MNDTQQLVIFEGEAGPVEVRLKGETIWLSQVGVRTISWTVYMGINPIA